MSIISNMPPRLALFNRCYLAWGYVEFTRYYSLSNSCRYLNSYFTDIIVGKFCKSSASSSRILNKPMLNCMKLILRRRTPFKIKSIIIQFISVHMINLWEAVRVWNKCARDKPMCCFCFNSPIDRNSRGFIPRAIKTIAENSPKMFKLAFYSCGSNPNSFSWQRFNSSKIRYMMRKFKSFNWQPNFNHCDSLCR